MARFDRLEVLNTTLELGLVPVFYHEDVEVAQKVVAACAAGGARVVEFTNRGDFAFQVFGRVSQYISQADPQVILGVGSVIDAPTAAMYIAHGASFAVGPLFDPAIARLCNRRKIAYMPGCGSVTEISQAEELGVEIVKVFPGSSVGGSRLCQGGPGSLPVDTHHAHWRGRRHRGEHQKLVQGGRSLCRYGLEAHLQGSGSRWQLGRDHSQGPSSAGVD
jgi:2-dehydro-3-deoxyphosphogluconate aldolase/(4S)-4-hydroxy-2-oxoglutarate aldolase